MNYLSKNLKFLRKKNSINQSTIAVKMKKGQSSIGNWENGISEPNINELLFLAHFFGISISDLLERDLGKEGENKKMDKRTSGKNISEKNEFKGDVRENEDAPYVKGSSNQLILEHLIQLSSEVRRLANNIEKKGV